MADTGRVRAIYDDLLDVHDMYARRMELIKTYYSQFPPEQAQRIPAHTVIDNVIPTLTNLDILLGISTNPQPWALIRPPAYDPHRPFVSFWRIAPTLGTFEQQANATERLQAIKCETPQEIQDKNYILGGLRVITEINDMIGATRGRIGQFLQG